MADLVFLDAHTRPRPSKEQVNVWSKLAMNSWWSGQSSNVVEKLGDLIGAQDHHLTLTAGGAESHYQVLNEHYIDVIRQTGRTHIITLEGEQPSIVRTIKRLEKFEVQGKFLPYERLTADDLREALRGRSSLLSISWAHPLTGVIQPIHDLIALCKEHDVMLHLDVGAACGKLFFQLADLDIDYLTLNGSLFNLPVEMGAIFSKRKLFGMRPYPHPYYVALTEGLTQAFDSLDSYAMEVSWLRDLLEEKLEACGAQVLYRDVERLPNTAVIELPGIHGEKGLELLKKEGIFASRFPLKPTAICFALSLETTQADIERAAEVFAQEVVKLKAMPFTPFAEEDAKVKGMRVSNGAVEHEGLSIEMSLLVDEEDGVIADVRVNPFGPTGLEKVAAAAAKLLIRKNYMQARRLSSELIEKELKGAAKHSHLNLMIDSVDAATESCFDIPIDDVYVAPPEMESGERTVYPGWENLTDGQKKSVITEVMERDVVPYVELDDGGVEVTKVEDNRVTIVYSGNCTSCYSSTGATLDAIGNILRHKIYPDLMVVPDLSAGLPS